MRQSLGVGAAAVLVWACSLEGGVPATTGDTGGESDAGSGLGGSWTSTASTTDADPGTGSSSSGDDSSSGVASEHATLDGGPTSTGDTTTDDGTTSASEGITSDGGETTGDNETGGDEGAAVGCAADCVPGCETVLAEGHLDDAEIWISGDRLLSHRQTEMKTILWDRATRQPIMVAHGWYWAELAGDLVAASDGFALAWFAAADGSMQGDTPAGAARGIATDGSYLWTASAQGLRVLAPDGSELVFVAGDFDFASARAVPDRVYARAPNVAPGAVVVVEVATGVVDQLPYAGMFGWWFADSGRFWTTQGNAYRIYDEDGAELVLDIGAIEYGAGDYYLGADDALRSVWDPDVVVGTLPQPRRTSRNAILSLEPTPVLAELGFGGVALGDVTPPCCAPPWQYGWSVAYDTGEYVVSARDGLLAEGSGEAYTLGRFSGVDASRSDTIVAGSHLGRTHVWTVDLDCAIATGDFEREPLPMVLSDDGNMLLSAGIHADQNAYGVGFHAIPGGDALAFLAGGEAGLQVSVSDTGTLLGRWWSQQVWDPGYHAMVTTYPGFADWIDFASFMPIRVAPDGVHAVGAYDDGALGPEFAYVVDAGGLAKVIDGYPFGFLDNQHLLIGYYEQAQCGPFACEVFVGSSIVALDGTVVQDTTLPETPGFRRVSATEIFVDDPPRVYDAHDGSVVWSGEDSVHEIRLGTDFIVTSDGADLVLRKWR